MTVKIRGMDDVRRVLRDLMPKEADKLQAQTALDVARDLVKDAKDRMPSDTGTMRAATKAYAGRVRTGKGATVEVGRQAYYWRFLEYGQGPDGVEHAFFLQARQKMETEFERKVAETFKRRLATALRKGL